MRRDIPQLEISNFLGLINEIGDLVELNEVELTGLSVRRVNQTNYNRDLVELNEVVVCAGIFRSLKLEIFWLNQ